MGVENRLRQLEGREITSYNSTSVNIKKYDSKRDADDSSLLKENKTYNTATDTTISNEMEIDEEQPVTPKKSSKKRRREEADLENNGEEPVKKKSKKDKKDKKEKRKSSSGKKKKDKKK